MKTNLKTSLKRSALALLLMSPALLHAQAKLPNMRAYDQSGINVFEAPKDTVTDFDGLKVRFGAGFTQSFQGLKHENKSTLANNKLYGITPGFNTANANLFMDVQLADGIRLNLTSYLSSRHHNETWVKGGYIQFDKLPFKGQFWDDLMKIATIKIGHTEINYGDQHFRRSDGGQTIYNPFIENYIMDAFTTEIGGEVYLRKNNFFGMVGVSNGMIKGNIDELTATVQDSDTHKSPSIYLKGGFDKQLTEKVRVRFSGSFYHNSSSGSNTLYGGDRTGSNYFMVMEKLYATPAVPADPANFTPAVAAVKSSTTAQAFSGRLDPKFTKKINAVMLNGFVKASGLELFGTYEIAKGRSNKEVDTRDAHQFAIDGVYRFGKDENLFIGARYNTVKAELQATAPEVTVDRYVASAGWFITKNLMLKGEYVTQKYKDYQDNATYGQYYGGKFHGYVIQAVVGF